MSTVQNSFSLIAHVRRLSKAGTELYIRISNSDVSRLGLKHDQEIEMDLGRVRIAGIVKTSGGSPWLGPAPSSSNAITTAALTEAGFGHGMDISAIVHSSQSRPMSNRDGGGYKMPEAGMVLGSGSSRPSANVAHQQEILRDDQKPLVIDDAFIREWEAKYDLIANDEDKCQQLVLEVAREMASTRTISENTFRAVWKWKGAMRVIGNVVFAAYGRLYAPAFRLAASQPPERKLAALIAPGVKLPGVEAATGSTLIHFMHPQLMPIIDVRTIGVLFVARLISTESKDLAHYEEFRRAIDTIRRRCPSWTLRQIDRALFAYHKLVLDKIQASRCR
jgi:hypothetical protein